MNLWIRAGGPRDKAGLMASIALAESGGRPGIVNSIGATGLWQIHPGGSQYKDPLTNARTAVEKYKTQGLQAWEAYTNGSYKRFTGHPGGASSPQLGVGTGGGRRGSVTVSGGGSAGTPGLPAAQTTNALLEALASQKPQIQTAGIAPPAFAAGPAMPKGYQAPTSAGIQSTAPNIQELASLVQPTDTSSPGAAGSPGATSSFTVGGANAGTSGTIAGSGRYPTARSGKLIGVPHQGTHTLGNWQSDNAVDIAVPIGTPMLALQDGVVVKVTKHPQGSGRFAGDQITIRGANGNEYFYGHGVAGVRAGQRISKGQEIGTTGAANGVAHLHFGQMKGDPREHTAFR